MENADENAEIIPDISLLAIEVFKTSFNAGLVCCAFSVLMPAKKSAREIWIHFRVLLVYGHHIHLIM